MFDISWAYFPRLPFISGDEWSYLFGDSNRRYGLNSCFAVGAPSVFLAGIVSFASCDLQSKMNNESHTQAVDAKRGAMNELTSRRLQMNGSHRLLLGMGAVLVFLAGFGFHKSLAQPQKNNDWVVEQVNLPPDIHPETLSRTTRSKETDFTDAEDKQIFNKINNAAGSKQLVSRWLGPTGIRL